MMSRNDVGRALVAESDWIYAKTMPQWPHWYTLRKNWRSNVDFEGVVQFIRDFGYQERFGSRTFLRLNINGMKYWSMGAPVQETILINRAVIEGVRAPYDAIAGKYDTLWQKPEDLEENQRVFNRLAYRGGAVLDIGCGTGLFLDYEKPDNYCGIDPSLEMLLALQDKHPDAYFLQTPLECFYPERPVDVAVALFGAASYVSAAALRNLPQMLAPGGRYFLMFYKPGYYPLTYERSGVEVPHFDHPRNILPGLVHEEGNFWIIDGPE